MTNFQRRGATSNTHAGREFEDAVQGYFERQGIHLQRDFALPIGHAKKKLHKFDMGSNSPATVVECKSYTWTEGGNSPSAKIRGMNEVMLHFSVTPRDFRKLLVISKDRHPRSGESLARHYLKTQGHLIGPGIEVWEFDAAAGSAEQLR